MGISYYSIFHHDETGNLVPMPCLRKSVEDDPVVLREMDNNLAHSSLNDKWWGKEKVDIFVSVHR
jgi:hypothetical protein